MSPAIRWKHQWTLNTQGNLLMNDNNCGYKMLTKMGWNKGKGMGKNEDGTIEIIKVKVKNNKKGVGFNEKKLQVNGHHDDFNALLSSLNADHSTPNESMSDRKNTNDQVSLEKHSKTFRNRLHYQKFIRGKDVSKYSKQDIRSIFGEKLNNGDNNFPVEEKQKNKSSDVTSTNSETSTYQSDLTINDYFAQKRQEKADKLSNINKESLSDQNIDEDQSEETTYPSTSNNKKRKRLSTDNCITKKSKCDSAISFLKGILKINKASDTTEKTCKSVSFNENISIRIIEGRNVNNEEENSQENDDDVHNPFNVPGSDVIHCAGFSDMLQKSLNKMIQRERKKAAKKARKQQKLASASQPVIQSMPDINPNQDINIDIEQSIEEQAGNSANREVEELPELEEKLIKLLKKAQKKQKRKNKCVKQQNEEYADHGAGMHQVEDLLIPDTSLKTSKKKKGKDRSLKHQREAIGESNNIGEQNHIQQEIYVQPQTSILCGTENSSLHEQGAQSSESIDSEQPKVRKPYVPKKNSWTTSQKLALKMSHYKDMFEKICQHSILSTSNLNEIKGYGNW